LDGAQVKTDKWKTISKPAMMMNPVKLL